MVDVVVVLEWYFVWLFEGGDYVDVIVCDFCDLLVCGIECEYVVDL